MEGFVPEIHLQISFLDQAIHLPRETLSKKQDAIKEVMVKSTGFRDGTL